MLLAVFKKVDCSKKVMLNHLPAARAAINARKYAWIGRSIDYPIGGGKSIKVARVADVEMAQLDAHLREDWAVSSLPGRLRLSTPIISMPSREASRSAAIVLPANPQAPVRMIFMRFTS